MKVGQRRVNSRGNKYTIEELKEDSVFVRFDEQEASDYFTSETNGTTAFSKEIIEMHKIISNPMKINTIAFNGFEELSNPEFFKKNNLNKDNIINVQVTDTSYATGFIFYYEN